MCSGQDTQYTHTIEIAFEVESDWPCSLPWKRQAVLVEGAALQCDDVIREKGQFRTDPCPSAVHTLKWTQG